MPVIVQYVLFAAASMMCNLAAQTANVHLYHDPFNLAMSVITGTLAGLAVKCVLDKHFIFRFAAKNATHDAKTFALYASTGTVTTAIFWSTKAAFHAIFHTEPARLTDAALGLVIGTSSNTGSTKDSFSPPSETSRDIMPEDEVRPLQGRRTFRCKSIERMKARKRRFLPKQTTNHKQPETSKGEKFDDADHLPDRLADELRVAT
ncbi:hypothetical protein BRCH_02606c [Candidatus Burkholderia brachyanthoides]|nr:hypothetical protein BRCH_02606c [Candidatus Burkholderia brachyanthoides]